MAKPKGYTAEQIILKLREAEVLLSQGRTIKQVCRSLKVSEQTYDDITQRLIIPVGVGA